MTPPRDGLYAAMAQRGVSRRSFLKFCTATAAALALPVVYGPRIANAVTTAARTPLVWVRGQACGGDSEAFLLAAQPTIGELLVDVLSVDYLDTLMAASGPDASQSLTETLERYPNGYIAVLEGAVPQAGAGEFCTIGGRPIADVMRAVSAGAAMTIAVGSCAFDGGVAGAGGGTTAATGAASMAQGNAVVSLPGCPVNVENLAATIVHWITFKQPPATDLRGRPLFAYGGIIHNQCERRAHFEFGEFALTWGDEGSQKGWCLYKLGCKGPETYANCPTVRYAEKTSWPVRAGHGCIGCTMPHFWDAMSPFYRRLPPPIPFVPEVTADQVGQALVGGVAAMTAVHGAASYVRQRRVGATERRRAREAPAGSSLIVPGAAPVDVEVQEYLGTEGLAAPSRASALEPDSGAAAAESPDLAEAPIEKAGEAPAGSIDSPGDAAERADADQPANADQRAGGARPEAESPHPEAD